MARRDPAQIVERSIPEPMSGCWLWLGGTTTNSNGMKYGYLRGVDGSKIRAHRYSYEAFRGPIPKGLFICHHCDTPLCVNPDHLFPGTNQDNVNDRQAKGRNKLVCGERHGRAKISADCARAVKRLRLLGVTHRNIAKATGVSLRTVEAISSGKSWRSVDLTVPEEPYPG